MHRVLPLALLLVAPAILAQAPPIEKGQRVFAAGHSFLMFMPGPLTAVAKAAGYKDHALVGVQGIGGSRVIQHWDLEDAKNKVKPALRTGKIDVLILSPHALIPDEGIDKLVELAVKHNPDVRVLVQASWYPFDTGMEARSTFKNADRDASKVKDLRDAMAPFKKAIAEQVKALNAKHKKRVVFIVPAGDAVVALREKVVEKKAPGVARQSDLFRDPIGHANMPVMALVTYCHYAAVYRKSPVGLKLSRKLVPDADESAKLDRLLQEIAWEAVTGEPLSGVGRAKPGD
jgi:hypothetical protein